MLNISEPPNENPNRTGFNHPIFEMAFRPYFLLGALTSIVGLVIWLASLTGNFVFDNTGVTALVWHINEMIFGFAATVAVGFIMTAVQTWAGRPTISKKPLAMLVLLWIAMRLSVWVNTRESMYLAIVLIALWWLTVVYNYARIVISGQNKRNYLFIPLLSAMGVVNVMMLTLDLLGHNQHAVHLGRVAVMLFTLLMTIIGGRVIPFFTVRGASTDPIQMPAMLEKIVVWLVVASVAVMALYPYVEIAMVFAVVMIAAGFCQLVRFGFWRTLKTFKVPLLWSLHLSYLMMAIGTLLLGVSQFNVGVQISSALHVITIGAVGLMILSMMSRVSLGHTGRLLQPSPAMSWAFLMMAISPLVRVVLPYMGMPFQGWTVSVLLWVIAMLIFLFVYIPILASPRTDHLRN